MPCSENIISADERLRQAPADSSGSPHMKNDKRVVYVVDVARILQALAVLLATLLN